jgi:hypothetical protein
MEKKWHHFSPWGLELTIPGLQGVTRAWQYVFSSVVKTWTALARSVEARSSRQQHCTELYVIATPTPPCIPCQATLLSVSSTWLLTLGHADNLWSTFQLNLDTIFTIALQQASWNCSRSTLEMQSSPDLNLRFSYKGIILEISRWHNVTNYVVPLLWWY